MSDETTPRPTGGAMALGGVGLIWFAQLSVSPSFGDHVLPAALVLGLEFGQESGSGITSATFGVGSHDVGVPSVSPPRGRHVKGTLLILQ